ncbi:MAG: flagellar export chaperone FliS [Phycisphaeraceae bacterium]|nr:flagellar export chaperone FliS [Phycisphaeraceae bacterium]MBX3406140.1 flagellar export chaperone FliS [Phycisphaeraceae bacterium]
MTAAVNNANAYLRTKVLTASPEELRLMLLEGAIKFLRQGRDGLERKDHEASFDGFSKCRNIVLELMNSVRPDIAPDLCGRVTSLYTFIYTKLVEAGFERDLVKADKVIEMLEFERETWALAMQKAAEERQSPGAASTEPARAPAAPLCVQG